MTHLHISDLPASQELDGEAMTAVRGGADNQAVGTSQANVQSMVAAANIGNGSIFGGPANIQSDNTFAQNASNTNETANVDAFLLLGRLGGLVRP
jgi:hypothetical protein